MAGDGIDGLDGAGVPPGFASNGIMAGLPAINAAAAQSTLGAVMTPEQMADVDWGTDGPPVLDLGAAATAPLPPAVSGQTPGLQLPGSAAPGPLTIDQVDPENTVVAEPLPTASGASSPVGMKISDQGKSFMQSWEKGPDGGAALKPYPSAEGGADTIGWGHKIQPGEDFSGGITQQQANQMFDRDIGAAQKRVQDNVQVPLSQQQYDALVSLAYTEPGALTPPDSTLLRKLNSSDYAGAADQFQVWNKGGRPLQVMPGLTDRRGGEANIFTNGIYTNHN